MLPSAGLRTPRVAVAEGPRPIAKQTSPLHVDVVAVKAPLGAEKVVGVAPALPPTPRLTVTPFPIPRVAHKLTNAPPQLVVVEVTVTPEGKVTPVGIEIALVMDPTPLVRDPTPLVMDATTLDSCERIEEMEAVASLWTEEIMLLRLVGLVTPLVRESMMLEASDTTEEMTPVADAPISLVREPTALVILEMMGTEENPGMDVLPVVPTLMIEDAPFVASLRMEEMALVGFAPEVIPVISDAREDATPEGKTLVGSPVISLAIELSALDPREVALVKPPRIEETWDGSLEVSMGPTVGTPEKLGRVSLEVVEPALTIDEIGTETPPDAPAVALTETGGRRVEAADERTANWTPLRVTPLVREL
jgi:hypothetical protein